MDTQNMDTQNMDTQKLKSTIALFPLGTTNTRSFDERGPWTLLNPEDVIALSMKEGDLLIDYEHQSSHTAQNGKPAPAAGWIVSMSISPNTSLFPEGVILAEVVWTENAYSMIQNGEYRFISPSFLTDENGDVSQIISAALVNQPAITSLPPLNREKENEASSLSLSSSFKRYFRPHSPPHSPPLSLHTLTVNLPKKEPTSTEKISVHDLLEKALQNGHITPAQRPWAELCATKAGEEFAQFLAVSPLSSGEQPRSVAAQKTTLTSTQNPDNDIIRILGINPQRYLQLQQKEASS